MAASASDQPPKLTLYSYWISSCSCRVRFALNFKGLKYEYRAVNLLKAEQYTPEFKKLNPTSTVPLLVDGDVVVGDSLAIILYLEEKYPQTPLLPLDPQKRAINYQAATIVSSGIQPFQNLYGLMGHFEPLKKLHLTFSPEKKLEWLQDHIKKGLAALEDLIKDHSGRYATGDEISLADIYMAPQIDAAMNRFNVNMAEFPLLKRLSDAYNELPAFLEALPVKQPDAPENLK